MSDTEQKLFSNLDFIAMLSHDLKTPVKAQIRAANLLYSGCVGEFSQEAKNIILNIIASNKYMQTLLDNVLGEYRINECNFILNKTENDFRKTLEEALCAVGILSEIRGQKVVLNYLCNSYIKNYDEIEIQRVIINLLVNAFRYSMENSTVNLTVKSNGGLSFDISSKVKDFYFEENNKTLTAKGYGLGLKICEKIINLHNGKFYRNENQDGFYSAGFILP